MTFSRATTTAMASASMATTAAMAGFTVASRTRGRCPAPGMPWPPFVAGMASAGIYRIGIRGGVIVALGIIVIRRVIGGVGVILRIVGSIIGVIVAAARIGGARGQGENQAK